MTKGEMRKLRRQAQESGRAIPGITPEPTSHSFSPESTHRGRKARDRWARRYDDLNGAPESDYDR